MSRGDSATTYDVAVLGLWHFGSVSTAAWVMTGRRAIASDPDGEVVVPGPCGWVAILPLAW